MVLYQGPQVGLARVSLRRAAVLLALVLEQGPDHDERRGRGSRGDADAGRGIFFEQRGVR